MLSRDRRIVATNDACLTNGHDGPCFSTATANFLIYETSVAKLMSQSAPTSALYLNAVTGLLPVVESIIRKMETRQNRNVGSGTRGLIDELQALVDREEQSPYCREYAESRG